MRSLLLCVAAVCSSVALGACSESAPVVAPVSDSNVKVNVSPFSLDDITDTEFIVRVYNGAYDDNATVGDPSDDHWFPNELISEATVLSSDFGSGQGDFSALRPCDASPIAAYEAIYGVGAPPHGFVTIEITRLWISGIEVLAQRPGLNPAPADNPVV